MNIKTQTVPKAVTEIVTVAAVVYDLSCRRIYIPPRYSRTGSGYTGRLCVKHQLINAAHFLVGLSDCNGSRHVGAVSVFNTAEIHGHEITCVNKLTAGNTVRHTRFTPRNNNRVKGISLAAVAQHTIDKLCCHITLGHAHGDDFKSLLQRPLRNALSLPHGLLQIL